MTPAPDLWPQMEHTDLCITGFRCACSSGASTSGDNWLPITSQPAAFSTCLHHLLLTLMHPEHSLAFAGPLWLSHPLFSALLNYVTYCAPPSFSTHDVSLRVPPQPNSNPISSRAPACSTELYHLLIPSNMLSSYLSFCCLLYCMPPFHLNVSSMRARVFALAHYRPQVPRTVPGT